MQFFLQFLLRIVYNIFFRKIAKQLLKDSLISLEHIFEIFKKGVFFFEVKGKCLHQKKESLAISP